MTILTNGDFPAALGVFNQTGHVVLASATHDEAEKARRALLEGGFNENDVMHFHNDEVTLELDESEFQFSNPMQFEQDGALVGEFLALANQWTRYLIVYAPEKDKAKLAIALVRSHEMNLTENVTG